MGEATGLEGLRCPTASLPLSPLLAVPSGSPSLPSPGPGPLGPPQGPSGTEGPCEGAHTTFSLQSASLLLWWTSAGSGTPGDDGRLQREREATGAGGPTKVLEARWPGRACAVSGPQQEGVGGLQPALRGPGQWPDLLSSLSQEL
jgi:hypothetical protein